MPLYLRQSTAGQEIPLGPFLDSSNGDDEETTLTINNTDIGLWKFGSTSIVAKNSGGATHMLKGIYYCVLDAIDTNTLGSLVVFIHVSGALYVKVECVVLPANVYDSLIANGDFLQVLARNIATGSGSLNTVSESFTLTTGNVASGSYTDTVSVNSIYHQIQDSGGVLDCYYQFDVGSVGFPSTIEFTGRVNGIGDNLDLYAWDWGTSSWIILGPLNGKAISTDDVNIYTLFTNYVGTNGSDLGKVRIRFYGTGLTSANLYIDQIYVSYASIIERTGYTNAAVWLDTVNGVAGTSIDYNGIATRPVNNISDARTIANNLGLKKIMVIGGSSVTLAASMDNFTLEGTSEWTLTLGGQSCNNTTIIGAFISGTSTGSMNIVKGHIQNCTIDPSHIYAATLDATVTCGSAGTYVFDQCLSGIAGTGTPSIDFDAAVGTTQVNFRHYSGGIEIKNMGQAGTDNMSLEGFGQYIINANCIGGTLAVRGLFVETDNSGNVTISGNARLNLDLTADAVWDEVLTGGTHNIQSSAGRILRGLQEYEGYGGYIWVDTIRGSAGITPFENGTSTNSVDNWANALTLANALLIFQFKISGGSLIVLSGSTQNYVLQGHGYDLDLNGQDISGCHISEANVSGIASGTSLAHFHHCDIYTCTIPSSNIHDGLLLGTITLASSGNYYLSNNMTNGNFILDFNSLGSCKVNFKRFSGSVEIINMTATDTLEIHGTGSMVINANCSGGTIDIYDKMLVDNNGSATVNNYAIDGIKKNTPGQKIVFFMFDTNGDLKSGLTVTGELTKDGGSVSDVTGTITEISGGRYLYSPSVDDLNGDSIGFTFSATGAKTINFTIQTSI